MLNKVILIGNVGADAEIRYINDVVATGKIKLATSETYTDKKGEKVTKTEWHTITVWNNTAKIAEKYVKKGMQLYIDGKIAYKSYEKDGETKYFTEIVATEMRFLGGKKDESQKNTQPQQQYDNEIPPINTNNDNRLL